MDGMISAAPGWWVIFDAGDDGSGEPVYVREPVGAWVWFSGYEAEALLAGAGGHLIRASAYGKDAFGAGTAGDVFSDAKPPRCTCGLRQGLPGDTDWCHVCPGVILR